ncbi:MAG: CcoQ/FixQ family Cbb3-type cytochrome c oxidase assembly chaperone [Bacteroidetes bacterium]|nr:CcoQ/FixQ family Cbb3-type cytochrome c oxidase assembly chaperone [Bacteroidota bacterium]
MISKVLSSIDGVSAYPLFSLLIFVPFFIAVTVWVFKLDKTFLNQMGEMPLNDSTESVEDRKTTL